MLIDCFIYSNKTINKQLYYKHRLCLWLLTPKQLRNESYIILSAPAAEVPFSPVTSQTADGSANTFKLYPIIILHFKACLDYYSDSQSQFPFLYFTRQCHLQLSICFATSNNVYQIHDCKKKKKKRLQAFHRCSFTSVRFSHFKPGSTYKYWWCELWKNYRGVCGRITMTYRSLKCAACFLQRHVHAFLTPTQVTIHFL